MKKDEDEKKKVITTKMAKDIKRRSKYNDEGDEAIADFTYDATFRNKESYEERYKDYRD